METDLIWGTIGGILASLAGVVVGIRIGRRRERLDQYLAGNLKDFPDP